MSYSNVTLRVMKSEINPTQKGNEILKGLKFLLSF